MLVNRVIQVRERRLFADKRVCRGQFDLNENSFSSVAPSSGCYSTNAGRICVSVRRVGNSNLNDCSTQGNHPEDAKDKMPTSGFSDVGFG